ncbi:MAG: right-handed parallel beta-helix repeat-containing protein [Treponema sp.]|nr:right-handed parallel beta-helix repeat-containing protein [Treponema sp.]
MKKIALILILVCFAFGSVFANDTFFVSARGSDSNSGLTEAQPFKTLSHAITAIMTSGVRKIVIIGMLDLNSEGSNFPETVFRLGDPVNSIGSGEVLITGKASASAAERAFLSARGSNKAVIWVRQNLKVRFENIDIIGAEGQRRNGGLNVSEGAQVILGQGAVVRDNFLFGVFVDQNGTFILDGGDVRDNYNTGVYLNTGSVFTMENGSIRHNRAANNGGGVFVSSDSSFNLTGGTITNNNSGQAGGGVLIRANARFNQSGGTINENTAGRGSNPNIFREG